MGVCLGVNEPGSLLKKLSPGVLMEYIVTEFVVSVSSFHRRNIYILYSLVTRYSY